MEMTATLHRGADLVAFAAHVCALEYHGLALFERINLFADKIQDFPSRCTDSRSNHGVKLAQASRPALNCPRGGIRNPFCRLLG